MFKECIEITEMQLHTRVALFLDASYIIFSTKKLKEDPIDIFLIFTVTIEFITRKSKIAY